MQQKAVGKRLSVSFCSPLFNSFRFREADGIHLLHLSPELNSLKLSLEPTVNFSAPRRMLQAHLTGLKSYGLRLYSLYLEEDGSRGNCSKAATTFSLYSLIFVVQRRFHTIGNNLRTIPEDPGHCS